MSESNSAWLLFAAGLNALAAFLHLAIIAGGSRWYRFFGAGDRLARAVEAGLWWPHILTLGITGVLAVWAAYALSAAGMFMSLPWCKEALITITTVYAVRGLALIPVFLWARALLTPFLVWSSVVCIAYGAVHLLGILEAWPSMMPSLDVRFTTSLNEPATWPSSAHALWKPYALDGSHWL